MQRGAECPKYKMYYAKMQGRGLCKDARQRPTKERRNAQNIKCIMQRGAECPKYKMYYAKRG